MLDPNSLQLPDEDPLRSLQFRRRTEKTRQAPYIPVLELLNAPRPNRRRCSESFHRRNLAALALTGGAGVRSEELRELNWEDFTVYALDPLASRPVGRLEDVLVGNVTLDDRRHALIVDIKDPKNVHERYVAVVAEFREAVIEYARAFIRDRVDSASSQRADVRGRMRVWDHFSNWADGAFSMQFPAGRVTRYALENDHDLWTSARELAGPARVRGAHGWDQHAGDVEAHELLAYLISFADSYRYSRAEKILRTVARGKAPNPIDAQWLHDQPVLVGPFQPSRKGGSIGEDQLNYIFGIYGWKERGFLPQTLRSNWQRFHKKYEVLVLEGGAKALGHRNTGVTGRSYDAEDIFDLVRLARVTASALRRLGA